MSYIIHRVAGHSVLFLLAIAPLIIGIVFITYGKYLDNTLQRSYVNDCTALEYIYTNTTSCTPGYIGTCTISQIKVQYAIQDDAGKRKGISQTIATGDMTTVMQKTIDLFTLNDTYVCYIYDSNDIRFSDSRKPIISFYSEYYAIFLIVGIPLFLLYAIVMYITYCCPNSKNPPTSKTSRSISRTKTINIRCRDKATPNQIDQLKKLGINLVVIPEEKESV